MAYFDGIRTGDKVWDFIFRRRGEVIDLSDDEIVIKFDNNQTWSYDYNGILYGLKDAKQTLFWDEIKFEIPKPPKIKLKECNYMIYLQDNEVATSISINCDKRYIKSGLTRKDRETAEKALKATRRFMRLLALRDQECPNSRGYEFQYINSNYVIYKNHSYSKPKYEVKGVSICAEEFTVYFKTEEDAQKICDILNSGRFDLEGE